MRPTIDFATLVDHLCHSPIHEARAQVSAWERGNENVAPQVFLQAVVKVPPRRLGHLGPVWTRLTQEEKVFLSPGLSRLDDDRKDVWQAWPTDSDTLLEMAREASYDQTGATLAWVWQHPRAPRVPIQKVVLSRAAAWGCGPVFFAIDPARAPADVLGCALESAVVHRPFDRDETQVATILDALILYTPVAQRHAAMIALLLNEGSDAAIARLPALRAGWQPNDDRALIHTLIQDYLTGQSGEDYARGNYQSLTTNAVNLWVAWFGRDLKAHFPASFLTDLQAAAPEAWALIEALQDPAQRASQIVADLSEAHWKRAAAMDHPGLALPVKLPAEPWHAPGASPRWKELDQVWARPELSDDLKERLWAGVAPADRAYLPQTQAFRQARTRDLALANRPAAPPVTRRRRS